jgi:hypothetical protein
MDECCEDRENGDFQDNGVDLVESWQNDSERDVNFIREERKSNKRRKKNVKSDDTQSRRERQASEFMTSHFNDMIEAYHKLYFVDGEYKIPDAER